jgi:hypothetical protein
MQESVTVLTVLGVVVSSLLSVIAYFLKYLFQDFRELQKDFLEMKTRQTLLMADLNRISEVLQIMKKQLVRKYVSNKNWDKPSSNS